MNDVSEKEKSAVLKTLAIIGFLAVIILLAWFSVRLVNVAPNAFSSLASLAETVNQYRPATTSPDANTEAKDLLIVTSDQKVVDAGTPVQLSWTEARVPGSYTFSYTCADGVAIDITDEEGVRSIACDTNYNIGNINTLNLTVDSEKERYIDVDYTLSFLGTSDVEPRASDSAVLTIYNASITNEVAILPDTEESETLADPAETEEPAAGIETGSEAVVEVEEPTAETPTEPATPTFEQEFTYTIPVSDPNGRTDLAARFLNVGTITGDTFFVGPVDNDFSGAIQFEVKNLGTKTSDTWRYEVTLPSGGVYESTNQAALKPNERAILTIGFPQSSVLQHTFTVRIFSNTDTTVLNNSFSQTIPFVD